FILRMTDEDEPAVSEPVTIREHPAPPSAMLVLRREDVFADSEFHRTATSDRLARDLGGLIRATAGMSAVRGLVALQRPVIELIADAMPATRGVFIPSDDGRSKTESAVGWRRGTAINAPVQVSRPLVERVIREVVGILSEEPIDEGGT